VLVDVILTNIVALVIGIAAGIHLDRYRRTRASLPVARASWRQRRRWKRDRLAANPGLAWRSR
jgi:hypothetical protein